MYSPDSASAEARSCDDMQDRMSGRFRKGSRVAILPFHALLHLRLAIRRSKSKEPLIQEVANGWYIGGWPYTEAALPKGDLSVVDCTSEYPRTFERPYICLPTWDTQGERLQMSISQLIASHSHRPLQLCL